MMDGEPQRPHLVLPKRKKCKKSSSRAYDWVAMAIFTISFTV